VSVIVHILKRAYFKRRHAIAYIVAMACMFSGSANAAELSETCVSPNSNSKVRANSPQPAIFTTDVAWRVTFQQGAAPYYPIRITKLETKVGTQDWAPDTSLVWELVWGLRDKGDSTRKQGTFADLSQYLPNGTDSPKVIAPDGGCAIFLRPAVNGQPSWRTVGVVGDSLTQELFYGWFPPYTIAHEKSWYELMYAIYPYGRLQKHMNDLNLRVEVESWGGRTLANWKGSSGDTWLNQASKTMLDEFRGMAKYWLSNKALVVALGANDAFAASDYMAAGVNQNDKDLRRLDARNRIVRVLAEMSNVGTCIVLVTPPSAGGAGYQDASAGIRSIYIDAAAGSYASFGVKASNLRVADFALTSFFHYGAQNDANNWFQPDGLHLNEAGVDAYALEIKNAVQRCP